MAAITSVAIPLVHHNLLGIFKTTAALVVTNIAFKIMPWDFQFILQNYNKSLDLLKTHLKKIGLSHILLVYQVGHEQPQLRCSLSQVLPY